MGGATRHPGMAAPGAAKQPLQGCASAAGLPGSANLEPPSLALGSSNFQIGSSKCHRGAVPWMACSDQLGLGPRDSASGPLSAGKRSPCSSLLFVPSAGSGDSASLGQPGASRTALRDVLQQRQQRREQRHQERLLRRRMGGQEIIGGPGSRMDGQEIIGGPGSRMDGQEIIGGPGSRMDGQEIIGGLGRSGGLGSSGRSKLGSLTPPSRCTPTASAFGHVSFSAPSLVDSGPDTSEHPRENTSRWGGSSDQPHGNTSRRRGSTPGVATCGGSPVVATTGDHTPQAVVVRGHRSQGSPLLREGKIPGASSHAFPRHSPTSSGSSPRGTYLGRRPNVIHTSPRGPSQGQSCSIAPPGEPGDTQSPVRASRAGLDSPARAESTRRHGFPSEPWRGVSASEPRALVQVQSREEQWSSCPLQDGPAERSQEEVRGRRRNHRPGTSGVCHGHGSGDQFFGFPEAGSGLLKETAGGVQEGLDMRRSNTAENLFDLVQEFQQGLKTSSPDLKLESSPGSPDGQRRHGEGQLNKSRSIKETLDLAASDHEDLNLESTFPSPTCGSRGALTPLRIAAPTHEDVWSHYGSSWRHKNGGSERKWNSSLWLKALKKRLDKEEREHRAAQALAELERASLRGKRGTDKLKKELQASRAGRDSYDSYEYRRFGVGVCRSPRKVNDDGGDSPPFSTGDSPELSTGDSPQFTTGEVLVAAGGGDDSDGSHHRPSFSDWSNGNRDERGGESRRSGENERHSSQKRPSFSDWD